MILVLFRHARAEERSATGDDAARALTPDGKKRLAASRSGLRALGFAFDRVVHSPLLRAVQTAEAFAADGTATAVHAGLAGPPDERLVQDLERLNAGSLCCIGHEPWLTDLAGLLAGGAAGTGAALELKKAGAIVLDGELRSGGMMVVALLPPRVLRRIARTQR